MAQEKKPEGCVAQAAGPLGAKAPAGGDKPAAAREEAKMHASVGKAAPDFEAAAYHEGGFKNVKLSDFKGKWVLLCFYPGDFTFV